MRNLDIALTTADQIRSVTNAAKNVFLERDYTLDIMAATLIAGQHGLLLGKPGISKTAMIQWIAASTQLSFFKWMLGNNDSPDDLFGTMSLKGMTEEDLYIRKWTRLSNAHIALLDEPGKMSSSGQNMLLRALNERDGEDDNGTRKFPLHSVWAGSNELFNDNPAFYDRFHVRMILEDIKDFDNLWSVMTGDISKPPCFEIDPATLSVCRQATEVLRQQALQNRKIKEVFRVIKSEADKLGCQQTARRYVEMLRIAAGNALLDGRTEIYPEDLHVFSAGLWVEPETFIPLKNAILNIVSKDRSELAEFQQEIKKLRDAYAKTQKNEITKRAAITMQALNLFNAHQNRGKHWTPALTELKKLFESFTGQSL